MPLDSLHFLVESSGFPSLNFLGQLDKDHLQLRSMWRVYMRENGTVGPFGVLFPNFIVLLASKLDMFPLKRSVSGV